MVFLTGSSGFVGQNLLAYISDFEIKTIDRQQLNNLSPDSYRDERLNGSEAIIHLAGKAHDLKKFHIQKNIMRSISS